MLRQPQGQKRQERQRKPNQEVTRHLLLVHYLLDRFIHGDEPFTRDLELIVELDGFFPALPTLDSGELQTVLGEAQGWHGHVGTETDAKRGASGYLGKDRASS